MVMFNSYFDITRGYMGFVTMVAIPKSMGCFNTKLIQWLGVRQGGNPKSLRGECNATRSPKKRGFGFFWIDGLFFLHLWSYHLHIHVYIYTHTACQLSPGTRDYNNVASGLMSKKQDYSRAPAGSCHVPPRVYQKMSYPRNCHITMGTMMMKSFLYHECHIFRQTQIFNCCWVKPKYGWWMLA